jgi:hypothetical protein
MHLVTVSKDVHKNSQHRSRQRCKAGAGGLLLRLSLAERPKCTGDACSLVRLLQTAAPPRAA